MFPINGPVCVSEDEGLFKVVMSTFYQHEQMVREGKIYLVWLSWGAAEAYTL